jgi:hypothetical protein
MRVQCGVRCTRIYIAEGVSDFNTMPPHMRCWYDGMGSAEYAALDDYEARAY